MMNYKLLGDSGLRVSELCLGAMTFGNARGWGANPEESRAVYDTFVEAGGNFIDTANIYQSGESETLLGQFIAGNRERHVIATKYSLASPDDPDPNVRGNHRKSMKRSVETSLKRLATDYVDLIWVHAWDGHTSDQELLRALDDLVREGKVLAIGLSDTPAWVCARMQTMAQLRGWTAISATQFSYSLVQRSAEREVIPMAKDLDMAMMVFGGLGSGVLTGKYRQDHSAQGRLNLPGMAGNQFSERNRKIVDEVVRIASQLDASPSQVALAWLRKQSPSIIPIVGARTADQLADNIGCLSVVLSEDDMKALDLLSGIDQGTPRQLLLGDDLDQLLHGNENRLIAPSRI